MNAKPPFLLMIPLFYGVYQKLYVNFKFKDLNKYNSERNSY